MEAIGDNLGGSAWATVQAHLCVCVCVCVCVHVSGDRILREKENEKGAWGQENQSEHCVKFAPLCLSVISMSPLP